jgi:hypothetical protein
MSIQASVGVSPNLTVTSLVATAPEDSIIAPYIMATDIVLAQGGITTEGDLAVLQSAQVNICNALTEYRRNGTKVVGAREAGWVAQTAAASKADLGAAPTAAQLASFCRALRDALVTHGLLGP